MIGIQDQIVEYPQNEMGIENKIFQLDDGKFYVILENTDANGTNKMNSLLKNDEIFGAKISDDTIFTYIIGTQVNVTRDGKIMRNLSPAENKPCNINEMNLWAKIALSKQEINTKHGSILYDSYVNYTNIQNAINDNMPIDEMDLFNGIIDRIYYAGELKLDRNNHLHINFLSGTFMMDRMPCQDPPDSTRICLEDFFRNKLKFDGSFSIDTSCKTFIGHNMTQSLLDQYVLGSGLKVVVFNNKDDATMFLNKGRNLSKIKATIDRVTNMLNKYPNNQTNRDELNKLTANYNELNANNFGMVEYVPQTFGGRKYKRKIMKKRKTKKYRYHKKYGNKNTNKRKYKLKSI